MKSFFSLKTVKNYKNNYCKQRLNNEIIKKIKENNAKDYCSNNKNNSSKKKCIKKFYKGFNKGFMKSCKQRKMFNFF